MPYSYSDFLSVAIIFWNTILIYIYLKSYITKQSPKNYKLYPWTEYFQLIVFSIFNLWYLIWHKLEIQRNCWVNKLIEAIKQNTHFWILLSTNPIMYFPFIFPFWYG